MNTYRDSNGNRWTTDQIERKIRKACLFKLDMQKNNYGYNFCETCKRNDCKPIDCAHIVSRKKCKEDGCVEFLWNLDNIAIEGRSCHQKRDKLNLIFT